MDTTLAFYDRRQSAEILAGLRPPARFGGAAAPTDDNVETLRAQVAWLRATADPAARVAFDAQPWPLNCPPNAC